MLDKFFTTLVITLIGLVLAWGIIEGMKYRDQEDCCRWQSYVKEYRGFYLTRDEAAQCSYWGIKVDAPVK